MSGFIRKAACRGHCPTIFRSYRYYERPELTARLLQERSVARFIVAPDGYGKSSLALDYAHVVFGFKRVYWVNGKSPCFLRDLDAETMVDDLTRGEEPASLVVFDDVPPLDAARTELFSAQVDQLLESGSEVVVTLVPSADAYAHLQRDRMRLGAGDLLLNDEEVARTFGSGVASPEVRQRENKDRVPGLAWAAADGVQRFCTQAFSEALPADMLLAMASMLVLGTGTFTELENVLHVSSDTCAHFAEDYPHLGIECDTELFATYAFGAADVVRVARKAASVLSAQAPCATWPELVFAWANMLCRSGNVRRACDVVRLGVAAGDRAGWLAAHELAILDGRAILAIQELASCAQPADGIERARVALAHAFSLVALGDGERAAALAKRHAFDDAAPLDARLGLAVLLCRCAPGALRERAFELLKMLVEQASTESAFGTAPALLFWRALGQAACSLPMGTAALAAQWAELYKRIASDAPAVSAQAGVEADALCIVTTWVIEALRAEAEATTQTSLPEGIVHDIERFVRIRTERFCGREPDAFSLAAALSWERARADGLLRAGSPLDTPTLMHVRAYELGLLSQRCTYAESAGQQRDANEYAPSARTQSMRAPRAAARRPKLQIPTLTLHMFGRFEARIGDEVIDMEFTRRGRVKLLLMILAVHQGREVHRDNLTSVLWPESGTDTARRNLYSLWSQLRKTLALQDGSCPYVVRTRESLSLDMRYACTDIERLAVICRKLLFEEVDVPTWGELYVELERDFASELLPSERRNAFIVRARNEYRGRLVDALIGATRRLIDVGEAQWGVWFARMALSHDNLREDAYMALMKAQVASAQRTAAMMTYLECRRVLREELGVDPSPEVTRLYEQLLEADENDNASVLSMAHHTMQPAQRSSVQARRTNGRALQTE